MESKPPPDNSGNSSVQGQDPSLSGIDPPLSPEANLLASIVDDTMSSVNTAYADTNGAPAPASPSVLSAIYTLAKLQSMEPSMARVIARVLICGYWDAPCLAHDPIPSLDVGY